MCIRDRHKGDLVRITSPSGGGYGNPLERDPNLVCDDLNQGLLSREEAKNLYGVLVNNDNSLDEDSTNKLRNKELGKV